MGSSEGMQGTYFCIGSPYKSRYLLCPTRTLQDNYINEYHRDIGKYREFVDIYQYHRGFRKYL
jgi:hypothetical protein